MARNFAADLQKGLLGQQLLLKIFKNLTHIDGRKGDVVAPNGDKLEVKCDYHGMTKSPNIFAERYSSVETLSNGGVWQAAAHGCPWFIYLYAPDVYGMGWRTETLLQQLEALSPKLRQVEVRNKTWTTLGYLAPRALLKPDFTFTLKTMEGSDEVLVNDIASLWGHKSAVTRGDKSTS